LVVYRHSGQVAFPQAKDFQISDLKILGFAFGKTAFVESKIPQRHLLGKVSRPKAVTDEVPYGPIDGCGYEKSALADAWLIVGR